MVLQSLTESRFRPSPHRRRRRLSLPCRLTLIHQGGCGWLWSGRLGSRLPRGGLPLNGLLSLIRCLLTETYCTKDQSYPNDTAYPSEPYCCRLQSGTPLFENSISSHKSNQCISTRLPPELIRWIITLRQNYICMTQAARWFSDPSVEPARISIHLLSRRHLRQIRRAPDFTSSTTTTGERNDGLGFTSTTRKSPKRGSGTVLPTLTVMSSFL